MYSHCAFCLLWPSAGGCERWHVQTGGSGLRVLLRSATQGAGPRERGAHHFAKEEAVVLLCEALELCGALRRADRRHDRVDHRPGLLSGGEQQRVAIARAVANAPRVLLADEPTGNLDMESGLNILNILKDLNNQGKTVIMITHNQEHASMFKKVIELVDGKIVSQ